MTAFFWSILWPEEDTSKDDVWEIMGLVTHHSTPMAFLLIDYICFNAIPFTYRHSVFTIGIGGIYIIFNMIYTLTIEPIYDVMDWRTLSGILIPIGTIFVCFILIAMMELITYCKLKKMGHHLTIGAYSKNLKD